MPQVLDSFQELEPTFIQGQYGVGKTSLALDVADHLAKNQSLQHVFWLQFTPEMKRPSEGSPQKFDAEILKMQGLLYQQLTSNAPVSQTWTVIPKFAETLLLAEQPYVRACKVLIRQLLFSIVKIHTNPIFQPKNAYGDFGCAKLSNSLLL